MLPHRGAIRGTFGPKGVRSSVSTAPQGHAPRHVAVVPGIGVGPPSALQWRAVVHHPTVRRARTFTGESMSP
jgi:hypothetical protein